MRTFLPQRAHGDRSILGSMRFALLLAGLALFLALERANADPGKEYVLGGSEGPWMVCVTSYDGTSAPDLAQGLVAELRGRHGLPAYVYNRGKEEKRKQEKELRQKRQQQKEFLEKMGFQTEMPQRYPKVRINEQCAVLVGGYPDMDAAHRAMAKIKKLPPPPEVLMEYYCVAEQNKKTNQELKSARSQYLNPYQRSFVTRNPLVPEERTPEPPDPLIKELNVDESYSLLSCTKPWTLVVKQFFGRAEVKPQSAPTLFIRKLFGGSSGLDACASQAHEVARVLREMKFDAYVLHTRYGSIVSVGNYDTQDDPRLLQNQRLLANFQLGPVVQFFPKPMPMEVPKF